MTALTNAGSDLKYFSTKNGDKIHALLAVLRLITNNSQFLSHLA